MKKIRSFLAVILAVVMLLPVVPAMASATETEAPAEGIASIGQIFTDFFKALSDFINSIVEFFTSIGKPAVKVIAVEAVDFAEEKVSVELGGSIAAVAVVTPANATNQALWWSSANEAVATFDGNGNIIAAGRGKTTITVESVADPTKYDTFEIEVRDPNASYVATLEELTKLKAEGAVVDAVLDADIATENIIHFGSGSEAVLDLNGKTITAGLKTQFALGAQYGAVLHITGEGTVNAGRGFMTNKENAQIIVDGGTYVMDNTTTLNGMAFHSLAQNDSKIVINGGTYISNTENAAIFYATSNGIIEVNGGFFDNTADETPDYFSMGTNRGNTNRVIFKGGTFVNYNPLEDRMCYTGTWPESYEQFSGPWMLVWDGYTVVAEEQENGDIWYSVVPVSEAE